MKSQSSPLQITSYTRLTFGTIIFIGISCVLLWGYIFYINKVSNIALYWLPFVNVSALGLTVYIDKDMTALVTEAQGINNLKYNFHSS